MDLENTTYKMYFRIFIISDYLKNNHDMLSALHFMVFKSQAV